jgi:hypothetical protein
MTGMLGFVVRRYCGAKAGILPVHDTTGRAHSRVYTNWPGKHTSYISNKSSINFTIE